MAEDNDVLFRPFTLGDLPLPNRILMAPLTRSRSKQPGDIPWELNATYYAQRASAGLIFGEATQVSRVGEKSPRPCMMPADASICSFGMSAGFPVPNCSRTVSSRLLRQRSSRKARKHSSMHNQAWLTCYSRAHS